MYGLSYFDVSGGAFAFALTAVFMPMAMAVFRRAVGAKAWVSAGVVAVGVAVAFAGQIDVAELPGLGLMAAGCFVRCCFIVKLNDFARRYDPVSVSALLCTTVGVVSFGLWTVVQPETFAALDLSATTLAALFVYGYFVVAFATSVNVFAQAHANAMDAALIYALEIVFSVVWAVVLPASLVEPSQLTLQVGAGCALVVLGNVVGQVGPFRRSTLVPGSGARARVCIDDADVAGRGLQ